MVCGSFVLAGSMVPAPGVWYPEQLGMNADCVWQSPPPPGAHGFNAWIQPSKVQMPIPCHVIPENRMLQPELEVSPKSSNSISPASTPEPRRVQSAARAAKRQRGRERRKLYKAAAHASKCLEAQDDRDKQAMGFEARAAAVSAELKLVVKHTFFEVDTEDSSSDDEMPLPAAFFKTTQDIDGWRRDYRRFRLGHHQGAKGEVTANELAVDRMDLLSALDLRSCLETRNGHWAALTA